MKVSIVPVLHLGSSVLVLLALALEYLRGQLDSLEYHGNGKLRIEADQCTLGNRCHNTLDMGFFTTISGAHFCTAGWYRRYVSLCCMGILEGIRRLHYLRG